MIKKTQQTRNMLPQHNEGHTCKAYGLPLSMVKVFF